MVRPATVATALGVLIKFRQADCVFPTRTARFGVALTFKGPLNLRACIPPYQKELVILGQD